jgi:hypothetical protein
MVSVSNASLCASTAAASLMMRAASATRDNARCVSSAVEDDKLRSRAAFSRTSFEAHSAMCSCMWVWRHAISRTMSPFFPIRVTVSQSLIPQGILPVWLTSCLDKKRRRPSHRGKIGRQGEPGRLRVVATEVVEAGLGILLTMDIKVLLGSHFYVALKPQNALREGMGP